MAEAGRVVDTQPGADPEGEAAQAEGAGQAVVVDPVAVVAPEGEDNDERSPGQLSWER